MSVFVVIPVHIFLHSERITPSTDTFQAVRIMTWRTFPTPGESLHKKWSFPLGISSVNVIKSAVSCWFGYISWRNPEWKTSFFVQCIYLISFLMRWSLRQVILFLLVRKWTKIVKMSYVDAQPYVTNYWREIKDKLEFEQVASDKIWSGISH